MIDQPSSFIGGSDNWPTPRRGQGPLVGLRILDLTRILAGPFATMLLADLGADVIKVEAPGRGDETRHWGPPFAPDGTATYYLSVNRNKRSLTLDFNDPEANSIIQKLAASADVMIDNFLPGRLARFGLHHETLRASNPRLISATISGFGFDNPYAERPAFDMLAQAMGGLMSITGHPNGEPTRVGVAIIDLMSGLYVNQGILAALNERSQTGRGRHVDVALIDSQVATLANIASAWLAGGVEPTRLGNDHPSIAPYELFETADSPIVVTVGNDRQFRRFVEALGQDHLANDPRFASNQDRVKNRHGMRAKLEPTFLNRSRDIWLERFINAQVPAAPINTIPEVFSDEVIRARMVAEIEDTPHVRSPVRLDGNPLPIEGSPPRLGEDTDTILMDLGLGREAIDALRKRDAV